MPVSLLLLLVLAALAAGEESGNHNSQQPRDLDFGSTDRACTDAQYMLQYSIPLSCNHALDQLLASLPNITTLATLGDLCKSHCFYPLRQAAVVCPEISKVFQVISGACCRQPSGERCFELVRGEVPALLQHHCLSGENGTECGLNCSAALEEVRSTTGCCFNAILNTSITREIYPYSQADYWTACGQALPGFCTWCSLGLSSNLPSLGVLTVLLMMAVVTIVL